MSGHASTAPGGKRAGRRSISPTARRVAFAILNGSGAVAAYVLSQVASGIHGFAQKGTMAGAAASIVIPIAGTTFAEVRAIPRAQRLRERLIDVTKQFAVTLDDAITPLANSVAAISSSTNQAERSRCQGQLIQAVVDAAARLCGDNRTRATFYEARPARGQIMTLVRRAYAGRGGTQPRLRFVRDEAGRDNAVIGLVEAREVHFIEDVKAEFPGQYDGKDYGTLIAVSVPGAERDCGMLAIDAPDPGDLEQIHVHTMQALAALLGSGLVAR